MAKPREKLLQELKSIQGLKVGNIVGTSDVGMFFEYATGEGYGAEEGYNVGDWPVFKIEDITIHEKWETLESKIEAGTLTHEDIEDTQLELIINRVESQYGVFPESDGECTLSIFLEPILILEKEESKSFFVMIDCAKWERDELEVFVTEEDVQSGFLHKYCHLHPWDSLEDDELEEWYEKINTELDSFVYYEMSE